MSQQSPNVLDLRNIKPQPEAASQQTPPPRQPAPAPKPSAPAEKELSPLRKWGSLLVLSLALAIIIIDTTLLNVSLRTIISDLGTNIQGLQWVISAYALTLAALTVTGGRLGDLFGRKRMFMLGAILFAIGSFIASISHNLPMLLAGESIIEGIGAALMMPATSSLLISIFHGRERALAFGVWGAVAAASSATGPILGGYLTTHYSWRWGFRINIGVTILLLLGSILIKEARDKAEKIELDFLGIILSSTGLLAIVFGIIESSTYGWFKAKADYAVFGHILSRTISITPISLVVGFVLLALFAVWEGIHERRGHTPLVSLSLFANKQFVRGSLTTATMSLGMTGLIFVVPVFLQSVRHLDALHTGLALLPMSLALMVFGPLSAAFSHKIAPKYLIQFGLFLDMIAMIVLHFSINADASPMKLLPGLALYGMGMGFVMAQVSNLTLSAVSVEQAGEASGVNNTLRQVGSALGSAILGAVLIAALSTNVTKGIINSTVIPEQVKPAIAASVGSHASNAAFGGSVGLNGASLPAITDEINRISTEASADAARTTLAYGAGFVLLALVVSLGLPKITNVETSKPAASAGH